MGEEFLAAKAEAAAAKAAGDKARQRTAGEMIRNLKAEMAELGVQAMLVRISVCIPALQIVRQRQRKHGRCRECSARLMPQAVAGFI